MRHMVLVFGVIVTLAGCGSTDKDRAISGGGIGAGLGAATGLVLGGPFGGLFLGGVFGVATGLVTDQDTIDLGKPIWDKDPNESDSPRRLASRDNETETPGNPPNGEVDQESFDGRFEILD